MDSGEFMVIVAAVWRVCLVRLLVVFEMCRAFLN